MDKLRKGSTHSVSKPNQLESWACEHVVCISARQDKLRACQQSTFALSMAAIFLDAIFADAIIVYA